MTRKWQPIAISIVLVGMLSIVVIAQNTGATVLLPVSVMDGRNLPVAGLKQENFHLLEENKEQKISFFSPDNSPLSIGIILGAGALVRTDSTSQSILDAVDTFKKTGNPSNDYFVEPYGTAGVEGAAERGLMRLAGSSNRRKILVMVIDSFDSPGGNPDHPSLELAMNQDVPIYFVFMRSTFFRFNGTPSTVQDERDNSSSWLTVFEDVARSTGGRLIYAEPLTTLNEECVKLAEELRNQYVLGFTSADDVPRGKWRNVKVNINTPTGQPKLTLRYKPRYFVPKPGKND